MESRIVKNKYSHFHRFYTRTWRPSSIFSVMVPSLPWRNSLHPTNVLSNIPWWQHIDLEWDANERKQLQTWFLDNQKRYRVLNTNSSLFVSFGCMRSFSRGAFLVDPVRVDDVTNNIGHVYWAQAPVLKGTPCYLAGSTKTILMLTVPTCALHILS